MKFGPLAFLLAYAAFAIWGYTSGKLDLPALIASGPLAGAAFAVGYAIDILIFVLLARWALSKKKRRHDAAV